MPVPSDYANLILQLKGDTGVFTDAGTTPAVNNGDAIQQWNDQSGVGNHATQVTAGNRPTLNTTGVNGRNVVACDSDLGQFFNLPDLFNGQSAGEIFWVIKLAAYPPLADHLTGFSAFGGSGSAAHISWTDGLTYETFGTSVRKDAINPVVNLASVYRVYNMYSAANDWASFLDKTLRFSTGTNTVTWTATPTIGKSAVDPFCLEGTVAEIVAYSRKLSDAERLGVSNYLGVDRYGLWSGPAIMPIGFHSWM